MRLPFLELTNKLHIYIFCIIFYNDFFNFTFINVKKIKLFQLKASYD